MLKKIIRYYILLSLFSCSLYSNDVDTTTHQETLFLRRIITCYQDQDFTLLESQIKTFLNTFPSTLYADHLYVLLADTYLYKENLQGALTLYELIDSPKMQEEVLFEKLYCYFQQKNFTASKVTLQPWLADSLAISPQANNSLSFYYAAALYQEYEQAYDKTSKGECLEISRKGFISLLETIYTVPAKINLASIYQYLQEPKKASLLYLELSEQLPEQKDFFLFQAANGCAQYDPSTALNLFEIIAQKQLHKAAMYNQLLLRFHAKQYQAILENKMTLLDAIPIDQKPYGHFILGQAHFKLKEHQDAIAHLTVCLDQPDCISNQELEKTLFALLESTFTLDYSEKFFHYFNDFDNAFSNSEYYIDLLLMKLQLHIKADQFQEAEAILNYIVAEYPNYQNIDTIHFEYALNAYRQQKLEQAYTALMNFINNFNDSQHLLPARRLALDITITLIANNGETPLLKTQLIRDIETCSDLNLLTLSEQNTLYTQLAKAYYDECNYQKTFSILDQAIHQNPSYPNYLLLALCAFHLDTNPQTFALYLEKALALNPNKDLHLLLFDIYHMLNLHMKTDNIPQAFDHLYQAMIEGAHLSDDTLLCLANHYFVLLGEHSPYDLLPLYDTSIETNLERSHRLFDQALDYSKLSKIIEQKDEILKLLPLFLWQQDYTKGLVLITKLLNRVHKDKFYSQLMLYKALYHEGLGNYLEAYECYTYIMAPNTPSNYEIRYKALLQQARLELKYIFPDQEQEKSLSSLQQLALKKYLPYEPIHLEAAIDHADFASTFYPPEEKREALLAYLQAIKNRLHQKNDIISMQYDDMRRQLPKKDQLYQAYMLLLDARIHHLEALIDQVAENFTEAKEKKKLADHLYRQLNTPVFAVSHYLVQQVIREHALLDSHFYNIAQKMP